MECMDCGINERWTEQSFLCKKCFGRLAISLREKYGKHNNDMKKWRLLAKKNGILERSFNSRIQGGMSPEMASTKPITKNKKVTVCGEDGAYIGTYKSLAEASRQTGVSKTSISQACNSKNKKTCGYVFSFAEVDHGQKEAQAT